MLLLQFLLQLQWGGSAFVFKVSTESFLFSILDKCLLSWIGFVNYNFWWWLGSHLVEVTTLLVYQWVHERYNVVDIICYIENIWL